MTYELGIDLGTTWTAAAVFRSDRATIVNLGSRQASVPSIVYVGPDSSVLVGEAAERRVLSEPERVARQFKRRIGDPAPILLGGAPHSAEQLTARLLRWVVDAVASREGEMPTTITITHPANWGAYKKDLLEQAVRLAGLADPGSPLIRLLSEPEAAAIQYAGSERVDPGDTVAVYDLGGGTFDVAVLRATGDSFAILGAPEGIERLGGIDFDAAVLGHVARTLGGLDDLDPDDPATATAVAHLREQCTAAKEALSVDTQTIVPVLLPARHTEVRLTRGELEAMLRPALEDTVAATTRAIRAANVAPSDLRAVVLVGGSSRIPLVAQLITSALGRPVAVDTDPKHAIALGAARHAHLTSTDSSAAGAVPSDPARQTLDRTPAASALLMPPRATPPPAPPPSLTATPASPVTAFPPPPAGPPPAGPAPPAPPAGDPHSRKRRVGVIVAAIAVVAALGAGAVAVLGGGSDPDDSASDTTLDTVAPDETAPEDTFVEEEEPFEEVDLRAGLLSALEVNGTIGTEGLQVAGDEVALFADILCDADDFVDQSAIVDYQSRLFDDPDAEGKVVAVGIIQFADTETADTFLAELDAFAQDHVPTEECPVQQADLGDGSIAFIESSAEVSEEGAVGFIKATDDIVSFVGHGDPTGMDPGVVAAMNVQQVSRIFEVVEGGAVTPAVEDLEAALLVPDDLGGEFNETLTPIDPALDFMCFGEPAADASAAVHAGKELRAFDDFSEVSVAVWAFPGVGTASSFINDTQFFLTSNLEGDCNLFEQPIGVPGDEVDFAFAIGFDGEFGVAVTAYGLRGNIVVAVTTDAAESFVVDQLLTEQIRRLEEFGLVTF